MSRTQQDGASSSKEDIVVDIVSFFKEIFADNNQDLSGLQ